MFNWLKRNKTKPQVPTKPIERWHIASETGHFVHLQLNSEQMPMQVFEELRAMNLRVITCGVNPLRDYKMDFYCERFDYGA